MNVYYWIQANRTKLNAIIIVLALVVIFFSKSEVLNSFCLGISSVSVIYFIWLGVEKIKNNKKEDIAE
ncbi:MAG: hypothetical protein KGL19_03500 [Bacteroidota bacterium]|nr:hypothetical protein [Bacteroidota bacterium]